MNGLHDIEDEDYSSLVDGRLTDIRNTMNSNIFKLNWIDVGSAVVSAVIIAVLQYITNLVGYTSFDLHAVLGISLTVGATSLLKALGTTADGKFAGMVQIK